MLPSHYLAAWLVRKMLATGDPVSWRVGLSSTIPNLDGTGITEPLATAGYARLTVPNDATNWTVPALGGITRQGSNALRLNFAEATAAWGAPLVCWTLHFPDGTYAISGRIASLTVPAGGAPYLSVGALVIASPSA